MTKTQLLEIIDKSTLKFDKDKRALYKKYFPLIKATLRFCPNDFELTPASSLAGLECEEAFEMYIRATNKNEIEERMKAILTDLDSLAEGYTSKNIKKIQNSATALAISDENFRAKRRTNNVVFILFISGFILLSSAIAVFAMLDNFGVIDVGNKIAGACGILDFLNGVAALIYERIDDHRKKRVYKDIDAAVVEGDLDKIPGYPKLPPVKVSIRNSNVNAPIITTPIVQADTVNAPINVQVNSSVSDMQEIEGKIDEKFKLVLTAVQQVLDEIRPQFENEVACQAVDEMKAGLNEDCVDVGKLANAAGRMLASSVHSKEMLDNCARVADRLTDLKDSCAYCGKGDGSNELLQLRLRIYCNVMRLQYNDICNDSITSFIIKEYRQKVVDSANQSSVNISKSDLQELERKVILVLRPDSESAKRMADSIIEKFQSGYACEDWTCGAAYNGYCDALRNQYNAICINDVTSFLNMKDLRGRLVTAAQVKGQSDITENTLIELEKQLMIALRPEAESVKREADCILDDYEKSVVKILTK